MIASQGKHDDMATSGLENLNTGIDALLNEIDTAIQSERSDTTRLELLERTVSDERRDLIQKRENIANLERKVAFLYAVKTVEELQQGNLEQRHTRFQELVGLKGVTLQGVDPRELERVLEGTVGEAYTTAILLS